MKVRYKVRKSRRWAFDGKNYQKIDNKGEMSAYHKKQPKTFAVTSATPYGYYGKRNLIISTNAMVDDSKNYVNPASKKQNVEFSTSSSSGIGTQEIGNQPKS